MIDVCKLMSGMEMVKRNQLFTVSQNKNWQTMPVQNKQGEMVLVLVICFMEILTKKHCQKFSDFLVLKRKLLKKK